ncbi:MAG: NAD(P)-dependent oxidoreductase [Acidobacteria bacterium]|nr:NAD(P)-dependent oxidoreductase [Acidobacteriota bacterium]
MDLPRLIITGASGFIGRQLLDYFKDDFEIVGLARRSQSRCGAPVHKNISWHQVDIADRDALATTFHDIRKSGGANYVFHLAAHYDFTGEKHPEYWRTNVEGMRNVLEECRDLDLERLVFSSSVAVSSFPEKGEFLTEDSPPDGDHVYAVTKRMGEEMLAEFDDVPSCIIRLAALFSDWCEYAPLYIFLETWLSNVWNSHIIGGKGTTAIPYMHVREMGPFMRKLLELGDAIGQREIFIASPSETLSHKTLFDLANIDFHGQRQRPIFMPKTLARIGVWGRDLLGRVLGNRPFERPWMINFLDTDLAVDASNTYEKLGWRPRKRLLLQRRMPFMVEHRKVSPNEWHRLNRAAMKEVHLRPNLRINWLLEKHLDEICTQFLDQILSPGSATHFPSYQNVARDVLEWRFMILLRHLQSSIRTGDRGLFTTYCRDLAEKRLMQGFGVREVIGALLTVSALCVDTLLSDPDGEDLAGPIHDYLRMTVQFGCDQILEIYEEVGGEELEEEF